MFKDPDWFYWAYEGRIFDDKPPLNYQAEDIFIKSKSIRISNNKGEELVVEYNFYYQDYTSVGFQIVPKERPKHEGATPTFRQNHIDMTVPRNQKNYDKLGYRIFLRSLKLHLFGNESARMTRKRCDDFYSDESNFTH